MSLPSWLVRIEERNERHVTMTVFVGPDADHRANAGRLVLGPDEFTDFVGLLTRETRRVDIEDAA